MLWTPAFAGVTVFRDSYETIDIGIRIFNIPKPLRQILSILYIVSKCIRLLSLVLPIADSPTRAFLIFLRPGQIGLCGNNTLYEKIADFIIT